MALLSRYDIIDIQSALDEKIDAHLDCPTNPRTLALDCAYCDSLESIIDALSFILCSMPTRQEVWIS
jgi:hypothetical protein